MGKKPEDLHPNSNTPMRVHTPRLRIKLSKNDLSRMDWEECPYLFLELSCEYCTDYESK